MLKRILASAVLLIIAGAGSGFAQAKKVEASGFGGWSFNDGVNAETAVVAGDGNIYDRVDPKDGGIFGASFGVFINDYAEAGFIYSHVWSNLVIGGVGGTPDRDLGGFGLNNYHGYFSYNFREPEEKVRPFVYGGLGATSFGSVDFSTQNRSGTVLGVTKFSTTWGGGAKWFATPKVAARLAASWTPTYIKTDSTGYWCDPFWGCYVTGNSQYSNQIQLTGGVTVHF